MPDDTSHPRYHLSETFRAAWAKLRPGPLQWPSDEAIADCSRGPRGIPAVPITVAPVLHGAVSLSLFEFGNRSLRMEHNNTTLPSWNCCQRRACHDRDQLARSQPWSAITVTTITAASITATVGEIDLDRVGGIVADGHHPRAVTIQIGCLGTAEVV